jgi:membrane protein DedA with SNARE-associated domain
MWIGLALALGTVLSEDAALASGAALAQAGVLSPLAAAVAVGLGIWTGDVALFALGRFAGRWPTLSRYMNRRWPPTELHAMAERLERRAAWAILLSRAAPGTRVPLYVAAGVFRLRPDLFLTYTAVAVCLWTTAIVGGVSWLR